MTFDDHVAARTIYGEARGEGQAGMDAVAHVIRNRLAKRYFGPTVAAVCLKDRQFSCWNLDDPQRKILIELRDDDSVLKDCMSAWLMSISTADPTLGATHYHTPQVSPRWAEGAKVLAQIGHHLFYQVA